MNSSEAVIARRELAARVAAAYVAHNSLPAHELPELIRSLDGAFSRLLQPTAIRPVPAVDPKKSVEQDYIISLEDGRRLKTLTRHLQVNYGLTPAEYRQKWNLPADYPMSAPRFSALKAKQALESGLGRPPKGKRRKSK